MPGMAVGTVGSLGQGQGAPVVGKRILPNLPNPPQKTEEESLMQTPLPRCEFHPDRVAHGYLATPTFSGWVCEPCSQSVGIPRLETTGRNLVSDIGRAWKG